MLQLELCLDLYLCLCYPRCLQTKKRRHLKKPHHHQRQIVALV